MKKMLKEFREFISRGNVMDLAVGVIIGGAFQKIVGSLVNDLVMPFIGLLTGGINFNDQFVILKVPEGVDKAALVSLEAAKTAGATTFNYGAFITTVIDFLLMALVIFLLIKGINNLNKVGDKFKKKEAPKPAEPTTKTCPFCKSEIAIDATRCPHCTSELPEEEKEEEADQ